MPCLHVKRTCNFAYSQHLRIGNVCQSAQGPNCVQETPAFEIPADVSSPFEGTLAGYVSMTVLPQHVSSRERIEKLAWVLLTLQAQLHTSIKDFKVCSKHLSHPPLRDGLCRVSLRKTWAA